MSPVMALTRASPPTGSPSTWPHILASEVGAQENRDVTQLTSKVNRGVSFFRQQVKAAVEGRHDPVVHQILSLADALEQEVAGTVADAGGAAQVSPIRLQGPQVMLPAAALSGMASPDRSYESMRQTLQDTQKRCELMLTRVQKESEANRGLAKAREAAEETSRKLADQVNQLTEKVSEAIRQKGKAEEQLEDVQKRCQIETDLREKDFERRIATVHNEADARCAALQAGLVNKLHCMRRVLDKVKSDFSRLRADHADSRKSVVVLNEAMTQLMAQTDRSISQRMEALVKNSLEHRIASSDAARELELRVLSEQELRLKEGASWNQRLAALQRERDHLQAQLSNDTAQLGAQLEDASRRRAEETSQLEAQICQLQTSLVSSESRLSEERSQNGETIANLKGQLAESAATLSAVRLQMQEVGHARDLLAAEVAETRLSLQSEQHRAEAQRSEATALLQQVETRNTALQDQVNDLQTAVNQLSKEASREREVLEADRQRLQEMLVKEAQQAKESQEQYDRWRESHVESLRRVQDETSAKILALEREKDGVQSELREAIRSLNTKQAQLEATDKDLQRLRSEAQEAAAVMEAKQQLSKELNEVTEALEGALRTEATLTGKIEDAAQRHQQEKRDLELQVLDKDSRLQKFKLDFETQLRISQSRLAGELNKEKAKADLVLKENHQLRETLQQQRKASSAGVSALHSQLESHILRLQQHTDELRGTDQHPKACLSPSAPKDPRRLGFADTLR